MTEHQDPPLQRDQFADHPAGADVDANAADRPAAADHPAGDGGGDGGEAGLPDTAPGEPAGAAERLWEISATLAGIQHELARHNERAAARERIIDRLHDENRRLRAGEHRAVTRPLVTDLQSLRNDLLRQAAGLTGPVDPGAVADLLRSFAYSIELTLERSGVRVLRAAAGIPFEPGRHRVVGVVPTEDPQRDSTVAEPVADGYQDVVSERVLLPATVTVLRLPPAPVPLQTAPPAE